MTNYIPLIVYFPKTQKCQPNKRRLLTRKKLLSRYSLHQLLLHQTNIESKSSVLKDICQNELFLYFKNKRIALRILLLRMAYEKQYTVDIISHICTFI